MKQEKSFHINLSQEQNIDTDERDEIYNSSRIAEVADAMPVEISLAPGIASAVRLPCISKLKILVL